MNRIRFLRFYVFTTISTSKKMFSFRARAEKGIAWYISALDTLTREAWLGPFSSPEPTILLACGRNRELWKQPFRACAIDENWVKPDGQNSVISFVISKWLLPELSIPAAGQKDRRLWGREWVGTKAYHLEEPISFPEPTCLLVSTKTRSSPCLGADQKARGLWERDWSVT